MSWNEDRERTDTQFGIHRKNNGRTRTGVRG